MIERGGRDDAAGALEPERDGAARCRACVPRLAHPRDEEHLVVHREPEEHREQEDRDPALDLVDLDEAEQVGADAPPEDDDEQAVDGGDGEQVQQDGLQRQQQRAEGAQQHEVGEDERGGDEPREPGVRAGEEVDALRRRAADVDADARPGSARAGRQSLRMRRTSCRRCSAPYSWRPTTKTRA